MTNAAHGNGSQMTGWVDEFIMAWKPIDTAPFERDVELAVINGDGKHAVTFPCRRTIGGWVNAITEKQRSSRNPPRLILAEQLGCGLSARQFAAGLNKKTGRCGDGHPFS
jgi:hypothetical protein